MRPSLWPFNPDARCGPIVVRQRAAIGVVLLVPGGRDLLAGRWTLRDFIRFTPFVSIAGSPLVQLATVGSQMTEALAGLDRIRELRAVAPETSEHAGTLEADGVCGEVGQ